MAAYRSVGFGRNLAAVLKRTYHGSGLIRPPVYTMGRSPVPQQTTTVFIRNMFIQTQDTPNPNSLKFLPGRAVLDSGTMDFAGPRDAPRADTAPSEDDDEVVAMIKELLDTRIRPTVQEDGSGETEWKVIKPDVFATIMDFFTSGLPVVNEADAPSSL
nr:Hirip5 protein [Danio rerio]